MKRKSWQVEDQNATPTLGALLRAHLPARATDVLVQQGAAYVGGKRQQNPAHPLKAGDVVMVILEESGRSSEDAAPVPKSPLAVVAEDARFLVVNKPPGIPSQPTAGRVGESILDLAGQYLGYPAGLVHRLDKDTSGLLLFAKTPEATRAAAEAFRLGTVRKRYVAVTPPPSPAQGRIDLPISRDPTHKARFRASATANGAPSATGYETLAANGDIALLALSPETGRTHQIRVHLRAIGAPIVGDVLYGGRAGPRCLLHAERLHILDLKFRAPPPGDFDSAIRTLNYVWPVEEGA